MDQIFASKLKVGSKVRRVASFLESAASGGTVSEVVHFHDSTAVQAAHVEWPDGSRTLEYLSLLEFEKTPALGFRLRLIRMVNWRYARQLGLDRL
jgi:hypothetical protein